MRENQVPMKNEIIRDDLRVSADSLTPRIKSIVERLLEMQGRLFAPVSRPGASEGQMATVSAINGAPPLDASIGSAHRHLNDVVAVIEEILERL